MDVVGGHQRNIHRLRIVDQASIELRDKVDIMNLDLYIEAVLENFVIPPQGITRSIILFLDDLLRRIGTRTTGENDQALGITLQQLAIDSAVYSRSLRAEPG